MLTDEDIAEFNTDIAARFMEDLSRFIKNYKIEEPMSLSIMNSAISETLARFATYCHLELDIPEEYIDQMYENTLVVSKKAFESMINSTKPNFIGETGGKDVTDRQIVSGSMDG